MHTQVHIVNAHNQTQVCSLTHRHTQKWHTLLLTHSHTNTHTLSIHTYQRCISSIKTTYSAQKCMLLHAWGQVTLPRCEHYPHYTHAHTHTHTHVLRSNSTQSRKWGHRRHSLDFNWKAHLCRVDYTHLHTHTHTSTVRELVCVRVVI